MTSIDKLHICFQVAKATMHSFETDSVPSLSHNDDLALHQFVNVNVVSSR